MPPTTSTVVTKFVSVEGTNERFHLLCMEKSTMFNLNIFLSSTGGRDYVPLDSDPLSISLFIQCT